MRLSYRDLSVVGVRKNASFNFTHSPRTSISRPFQELKQVCRKDTAYDGFERRVKKVADGVTTHYHYDLNGRLIAETDGAGNPIRDYVYLDGEPVAMRVYGAEAGWYWFLNDHLGTPQKLVDNAGAVVWQAAYMPFGEARVLTADVENNLRFPGQYFDAETGLHYNWHRYYDPETGRYLRPDPIGLGGGINLFAYSNGNPVNNLDIDGLAPKINTIGEIEGSLKQSGVLPSYSFNAMDYHDIIVMSMFPEILVPKIIGDAIFKNCIKKISSRAARRAAMRKANTPTSRSALSQTGSRGRRQYLTEGNDGKPRVQTEHPPDAEHPLPHWHDAAPKIDPLTQKPIRNQYDQIKGGQFIGSL